MSRRGVITALAILVSVCPGALPETVALYFHGERAEVVLPEKITVWAALEGGIMEVFFDAGHIAFPVTAADPDSPEPPFKAEPFPIRQAKSGGASWFLDINLVDTVLVSLTDLAGDSVVLEPEIIAPAGQNGTRKTQRELWFDVGIAIANRVLELLR